MKNNICIGNRSTKITVIILASIIFAMLGSYYAFGEKQSSHVTTIRMAFILFRHGEKNPTSFYPNDPHLKHEWTGGLGALTAKGSLQAYNLGRNLRKRYKSILPKNGIYSQEDMYVRSSYAERCIMSAQSLLAGLMPVSESSSFLPLPWQPVAITTVPRLEDTLIAQKKPCAKYDEMLKNIYITPPPDLDRLNAANADLYFNLSEHTGKTIANVLDVEFLYNTLKTEEDMGLTLPRWTEGIYPDQMLPLTERSYTVFTDNDYMKRIKGGAFLSEVYNKMLSKTNKTLQPNRSLFLYSGHDVTLVNVMNSMGILSQTSKLPDFSSALSFELHEHSEPHQQHEVKIVYCANGETDSPSIVDIPDCPAPCVLAKFGASIVNLLFENYDDVCENPKKC